MTQRKKWGELTTGQRSAVGFGGFVQFVLLAAALWDMWRRPPEEINGDRRLWTLVASVNIVGPMAYFLFGRKGKGWPELVALIESQRKEPGQL